MYFRCRKGENMVAGHLRQKDGYWHLVLSFIDENGNKKTPSKSTNCPSKTISARLKKCFRPGAKK